MKIKITPIGSCRITNPLKKSIHTNSFQLNKRGIYGYTHTSGEALQQLKYLQNEYTPTQSILPILSRTITVETPIKHLPSDLYFVEISSLKTLMIGDEYVQLNYVSLYFNDFFLDPERTASFWLLAKKGCETQRLDFLESEPVFQSYPKAKQELLSSIYIHTATEFELKQDIKEIMNRLEHVVFVTHCNPKLPDGTFLKARNDCINLVEQVCKDLNSTLYNPTCLMNKIGQSLSLKNHGHDFTHYTPDFESRILADWHHLYIDPLFNQLLKLEPRNTDRLYLIKSYFNTKQYQNVITQAELLLTKEQQDAEVIRLYALAAIELGAYDKATAYLEKLYQFEEYQQEAAFNLAALLEQISDYEGAITWVNKALELNPNNLQLLSSLNRIYSHVPNEEGIKDLMQKLAPLCPIEMSAVIKTALKHNFVKLAANGLVKASALWPQHPGIKSIMMEVADGLKKQVSDKAKRQHQLNQWVDCLCALLLITPRDKSGIQTRREFIIERRNYMREAYNKAFYDEAITAGRYIIELDPSFPECIYS